MANYDKLKNILNEVFQLDQADLDFGIYRIMNQKREEIQNFLDKDLLPQVKKAFEHYQEHDSEASKKELNDAVEEAKTLGIDPDSVPKVQELKDKLVNATDTLALENEVYSHLASFFRRYYDKGDFISMRRYKNDVYAIPYEGEEVKLHWANADQYYTKTTEYFRNYSFRLSNNKTVNFVIIDAETEQNNNKNIEGKERRFAIFEETPVEITDIGLNINFTYSIQKETQDKLNTECLEKIKSLVPADYVEVFTLKPTEKNKSRTLLEKHMKDYTARNTFDYFIHKDLGGFLNRELDFYIKNEVLFIDDINTKNEADFIRQLDKIRAIKDIAGKIITFLAQLENFQKKLWLKKKFVVETNYCITLDRVPEELYPEIITNQAQIDEWKKLFHIQDIKAPEKKVEKQQKLELAEVAEPVADYSPKVSFCEPLTVEFLNANPFLVLDTMFFNEVFKTKLLASIHGIDEKLEGLLIHSDNFQALGLIQNRFNGAIKGVYIDPPYNTDASSILYKNDYKDSAWISLMENRLGVSSNLLSKYGMICVAIDDAEVTPLRYLLSRQFLKEIGIVAVRSNPAGRKTKGRLAPAHEYALFYGVNEDVLPGSLEITEKRLARYPKTDEKGNFAWANFIRSGNNDKRSDRPKLFYPIFVNISTMTIRIPKLEWDEKIKEYKVLESPLQDEKVVFPIVKQDNTIIEKNWQRGNTRVPEELDEYRVRINDANDISIDFKTRMDENSLPTTWWDNNEYASANYGAAELKEIFGNKNFDFAKSRRLVEDCCRVLNILDNEIILDYFSGSATTGHAVISLNRSDQVNRKYILVEMGQYFDLVTKPRIQKVIYSKDWKDGKPVNRDGVSHCFKYIRLESYEDTLNNLILHRSKNQQTSLNIGGAFREEYMLGYMLDVETEGSASLLNVDSFENPFECKLNITRNNETKTTTIDMVETFNYLIGLVVETIDVINGYKVVIGKNLAGEKILVIWRNLKDKDNKDLEKFFLKQQFNTRDAEFSRIYVNGDNNLENLKTIDDKWKVVLIEEEFKKRMFEMNEL